MAKRRQRQGVSGNPARRAGAAPRATAGPTGSSGARRGPRSYVLAGGLVVAIVLVLFVLGPGGEQAPPGAGEDPVGAADPSVSSVPDEAQPTEPPRQATDEEFCAGFVRLANSQGTFVSEGETRPGPLQEAADDLVAIGVPQSMSLPARTGYHAVISGVYETIGLELPPEAVGAAATAVDGADAAFTAYLDQECPA